MSLSSALYSKRERERTTPAQKFEEKCWLSDPRLAVGWRGHKATWSKWPRLVNCSALKVTARTREPRSH